MLKLYKEWYLDADQYQYIVGKLKDRTRNGVPCRELNDKTYHPTIAAAVNHVLEVEMREKVKGGDLMDLGEAVAYFSSIADDLLGEIESIPGNLKKAVMKRER